MDREGIRAKLAQQLNLRKVPDELWRNLDRDGYVRDAELDSASGFTELAQAARKNLVDSSQADRDKRAKGPLLRKRQEVDSRWRARRASRVPAVQQYRSEALGGHTLIEAEARALIGSLAACCLTLDVFRHYEIPVVGHAATGKVHRRLETQDGDDAEEGAELWEQTMKHLAGHGERKERFEELEAALAEGDGGNCVYQATITPPDQTIEVEREGPFLLPALQVPNGEFNAVMLIPVWPSSVLDRLRLLSDQLAQRYDWEAYQASWWVLTGTTPLRSPIRVRRRDLVTGELAESRIIVETEPWIPEELAQDARRKVQREVLGRDNHLVQERSLTLFDFVDARRDEQGQIDFKAVWRAWNQEHPDRLIRTYGKLREEFERVQVLLFSGLG